MRNTDHSFVSETILPPQQAPASEKGVGHWVKKNLLATPKDVVLTVLATAFLAWAVPHVVNWLFIQAAWTGTDRTFCATTVQGGIQPDGWSGACWAFIGAKIN